MVKKNTKSKSKKEKTIHLTAEQAAKFIRGIQECLADAYGMEDSEFFMDGIEQTMEECGVPQLKPVPPKGEEFGATLGPFTYVGPNVKVDDALATHDALKNVGFTSLWIKKNK